MGSSSKVVLVGATSLIIGIYGVSLKSVQSSYVQAAQTNVSRVQRGLAADAAMRSALSLYQSYGGAYSITDSKTLPGKNGNFTCSVIKKTGTTATATVNIVYPDGSTQLLSGTVTKLGVGQHYKVGPRKIHKGGFEISGYYAGVVKKPKT